MRLLFFIIAISFIAGNVYSQAIPNTETNFDIKKAEKQQFEFFLQKGYTLKAVVKQMGVDLSISIYKKGDTARLAFFDSPNGEFGPEKIQFEAKTDDQYTLVVEPIAEDTALMGKYSIRQIAVKIFRASSDSSFADGSHIILDHPTALQIENLSNLGMLWGFLKYYHPAVAAGEYNWDASLFKILPDIIKAKSKEDANTALEKWVDEIGKPARCKTCDLPKSDTSIQGMPDYGKLFSKENLGPSLVEKLNFIKENRNQEDNYYVSLAEGIGNPVFDNERPYKNMIYPDAGYRLLSVFRYWNIIQYFYPYKYVIGEDWNKVLPEFIPKFVNAENATQYALACLEIIARIHDSHAGIWGNKELTAYFGKYAPPVRTKFVDDKLVVVGYYSDTLFIREHLKVGDIITMINGKSVRELVKEKGYLTPGSNEQTQLRDIPYSRLLRSQNDSLKLDVLREGRTFSSVVHCIDMAKINFYAEYNLQPNDSSYKIIDGDIAYIFPGRYHDRQLPEIKKAFAGTKGMIIDMRTYPSEFMPFSFGPYIKPAPSPFVKFTSGDVSYPGIFRYSPLLSNGENNPSFYKGPIVELVNSITQSQAEYTTMAFQTAPDITVIGSTTAGADGNVSGIYLPGGIYSWISGIGVFYPDGTKTQRVGIKIDKIVRPTVEGIKAGKDELLDEAIKIIRSKTR